ncbi:glutathione S-transferase N-terminal domain-containing protein [Belnapia sp. T18]|uniref:Glutathione S-transferase N-terminal domain-containing protein n=1 Tax=Belnapia arida TaxID=2804533 RepID=A0ABS1UHH7_9PROT|nr:glutathione S-transferase N-terminal domain-containing protein [Belnapia arida]
MLLSQALPKLRLYYSEGSPYARICRMALREGGLVAKVQEAVTTLRDPAASVLTHSPVGRVPALVLEDGTTVTETTLILGWLDRVGSQPAMLPVDAVGLAAYGRVLGLLDGIAVWNRELRRPVDERSPSVIALEVTRAGRVADVLEEAVVAGAYNSVDAGYLALAAVLGYAEKRHTVWRWRLDRPGLARWFGQASERACFLETVPPPSGI